MGETCGVCQQNESKYKCPSCQLRYCSIACYKQHKETHVNDIKENKETRVNETETPTSSTSQAAAAAAAAPPSRSKKINFAGFENDPELLRLMTRYPRLRIQLQSVYGLTLEPPPQERAPSSFNRGRGGRGGGRYNSFQHHQPQWTQAKGDKEATESFKNMRNAERDAQGLAEFVHLIKMRYAPEQDDAIAT